MVTSKEGKGWEVETLLEIPAEEALRGFCLALSASGCRSSTVEGYRSVLRTYFGQTDEPYERASVLAYLGDVAGRCSRPTLLNYYKGLQAFFEWAVAEEIVGRNPMAGLRRPRVGAEEAVRDAPTYTREDLDAMMATCPAWTWMGRRDKALLLTLWHTPLRASELCGLDLEDVEWEVGELRVRSGKGGVRYEVAMPADLAAALDSYLRWRPHDGQALFVGQAGSRLTPHALALMLRRRAGRAGLRKAVFPHGFRHNFRVRCRALGLDDADVSALLGHRSIQATWGYGRRQAREQAKARLRERLTSC